MKRVTKQLRVARLLVAAADLLERRGWTQYAFARNKAGYVVDPLNGAACAYCLDGALRRVAKGTNLYGDLLVAVEPRTGPVIAFWNDRKGREASDVINMLRVVARQIGGKAVRT